MADMWAKPGLGPVIAPQPSNAPSSCEHSPDRKGLGPTRRTVTFTGSDMHWDYLTPMEEGIAR